MSRTSRTPRRAKTVPCLEVLEGRALLSVGADPVTASWAGGATVGAEAQVLMRFNAGTAPARQQADLAAVGGKLVTTYPDGPSLVSLPPWADRAAAVKALAALPDVAYAEPNATFRATGLKSTPASSPAPASTVHAEGVVIPNNPGYPQEWGMNLIDAPNAWGVTTGTSATIVAVLDTGIDLNNPAFAGRIWTNPTVNKDGYVGDLHGYNFYNNTGNITDRYGHGTHVAGVIAAAGNNGTGVAGIDWQAQVMPVKVLDDNGDGSTDSSVAGVYFAVNHGAKVINASWGGDTFSQAMLDALNYANARGVVFVTAAGNESSDNNVVPTYPASYRTPNELVVAAADRDGSLASYSDWGSNWGKTTVDLAAPGVDIYSTVPNGFDTYSGSSMATAFVSGAVALLSGANPGLNAAQLTARVRATVKPVAALNGLLISPGVVDPYYALVNHVTIGPGATTAPSKPPANPLTVGGSSLEAVEAAILTTDAVYAADGGTPWGYVARTYEALVGRGPTASESSYYVNALQSGMSRLAFVQGLQNSTEGRLTRVAKWYRGVIFSKQSLPALKADPGVIAYANQLARGATDTDVLTAMVSNSGRYFALGGTPQAYVNSLYVELLGRNPEPGAVAYQSAGLLTGAATPAALARGFLGSPEGRLTLIARLYVDDLGSTAPLASLKGDGGIAYWARYLGTA